MAFRRMRRPFRRFGKFRRRSRPADIVPFGFCDGSIVVASPSSDVDTEYTCVDPFIDASCLISGGARDAIIRTTAASSVGVAYYYQQQGMERGISFLGMRFDHDITLSGRANGTTPAQLFRQGAANFSQDVFSIYWNCGIVLLEEKRDPVTGGTFPTDLPNLFSHDERDLADVLYRWDYRMDFVLGPDIGSTSRAQGAWMYSTRGTYIGLFDALSNPVQGPGDANFGPTNPHKHYVRNRRKLDEQHGIYFVKCMRFAANGFQKRGMPIVFEETALGLIKTRGRF